MWARVIECMLAFWLALSPHIFFHETAFLWKNDLTCGTLVLVFSLLSFHSKWSRTHLANLFVAFWLIGLGFVSKDSPLPPALENHVIMGLILLIFALVPSHSERPSSSWENFYRLRWRGSFKKDKDDLL